MIIMKRRKREGEKRKEEEKVSVRRSKYQWR
jgi:hypothetical protein